MIEKSSGAKACVCVAVALAAWGLQAALPEDDVREVRIVPNVFPLPGEDKVVLQDAVLDEWEVASAELSGSDAPHVTVYPSMAIRTNGIYEVQLFSMGSYVKGLKLQFRQSGGDVVCRAAYARYSDATLGLGVDMDYFHRADLDVSSSATAANYGIDSIVFRKRTGVATTTYSSDTLLTGPFVVNAPVVVLPDATFGDSGRLPAEVRLSDRLDFVSAGGTETTLTTRLSGFGGVFAFRAAADSDLEKTYSFGSWDGPSTDYIFEKKQLILPGLKLSDIVSFENVRLNGGAGTAYHFRSAGENRMTVQMQRESSSYISCAQIELTENASGVSAVRTHQYYCLKSNGGVLGMDLEAKHEAVEGNYYLVAVKVNTRVSRVKVVLSGSTSSYGSSFDIHTNVEVVAQADSVLPTGGVVTVENGGCLRLAARSSVNARFQIKTGGVLYDDAKAATLDRHTHVDVEGGTLCFANGGDGSYDDDAKTYLNSLTVSDGGVISGAFRPRVGNAYDGGYQSPRWRFTGDSPSCLKSGFLFVGGQGGTVYIDVDDVTRDAAADLDQTGELRDFTSDDPSLAQSTQYGHIRKCGAGTWRLDAVCRNLFGDVFVDAGTLLLARHAVFPKLGKYYYKDTGAIKLNGGTLACEENVTNALCGVQLKKDSTIRVAPGGHFDITSCAGITWTAGAKLTVEGFQPKSIRFGTSSSALTRAQARAIRIGKFRGALDEDGYLVPNEAGLVILFR